MKKIVKVERLKAVESACFDTTYGYKEYYEDSITKTVIERPRKQVIKEYRREEKLFLKKLRNETR